MAPAIDAKIGALMGNDIVCHGKPPLGVAPSSRERAHVQKTKGVQIGGVQMNGHCKIPIRERYEMSIF